MATHTQELQRDTGPSIGSLVQGIVKDVQELTAQQLNLLKTEMQNDFARTRTAMLPLIIGMIIILAGGLLIATGLAQLLHWAAPALPLWAAYLIVGAVVAAAGGVTAYLGYRIFTTFNPLPDKSVEALKENLTWPTKN